MYNSTCEWARIEQKRTSVCKKGWILKPSNSFLSVNAHYSFLFFYFNKWTAHITSHRVVVVDFLFIWLKEKRNAGTKFEFFPIEWCYAYVLDSKGFYCTSHVVRLTVRVCFAATSHDLVSIIKLTNSDAFINNKNSAKRIYSHPHSECFVYGLSYFCCCRELNTEKSFKENCMSKS